MKYLPHHVRPAWRTWLVMLVSLSLMAGAALFALANPHPAHAGAVWGRLVHTATASNMWGDSTIMSELGTDPTLIVLVTTNFNPNATCACIYDKHPLGVWWTGSAWAIFHEDGAAFTPGATYNISAIQAENAYLYHFSVQTATTSNSSGDALQIDDPTTNNNPNAAVFVTPNYNVNGICGCIYDNHPIGVFYGHGKWAIFNEDGAAMPLGAAFNIQIGQAGSSSSSGVQTQIVTTTSYIDPFNATISNGSPQLLLFVTSNAGFKTCLPCVYNPYIYDTHPLGVYYQGSE